MFNINNSNLAINGGTPVSPLMIPFGRPSFGLDEEEELIKTLRSGWIGYGPKSIEFENYFNRYIGSTWALSTSSCTAALHMALIANGVKEGDEVITTPLTFAATINAIDYVGAVPVLADINPNDLNIDFEKICAKKTDKTNTILPVHFGGLPVQIDEIEQFAINENLSVVYDAAHALGSEYKGKKIGNSNYISCFSFYANKNITTVDGGMLTSNDRSLFNKILRLRMHGLGHDAWARYEKGRIINDEVNELGYKYNTNDLFSSIGIHQLKKIENFTSERTLIADYYENEFNNIPGVKFQYRDKTLQNTRHSLHLFVIILDQKYFSANRNEIVNALRKENIGAAIHYRPVFNHKYYVKKWNYIPSEYPNALTISNLIISIPNSPSLSKNEISLVIDGVKKVLHYYQS